MMKPHMQMFRGFGLLAGVMISLTLAGCGTDVTPEGEQLTTRSADLDFSGSIYDGKNSSATQCTVNGITMHCCPTGSVMTGAHLDANIFKCSGQNAPVISRFMDGPDSPSHVVTQRQNMHACPFGSVMIGFHRARNDLYCAHLGLENPLTETVDGTTQDPAMPGHVCPSSGSPPSLTGAAMSGIRDDQNKFLCAR